MFKYVILKLQDSHNLSVPETGEQARLDLVRGLMRRVEVEHNAANTGEQWHQELGSHNYWYEHLSFLGSLKVCANVAKSCEHVDAAPDGCRDWEEQAADQHACRDLLDVLSVIEVDTLSLVDLHPGLVAGGHRVAATALVGPSAVVQLVTWKRFLVLRAELFFQEILTQQLLLLLLADVEARVIVKEALEEDHEEHDLVVLADVDLREVRDDLEVVVVEGLVLLVIHFCLLGEILKILLIIVLI